MNRSTQELLSELQQWCAVEHGRQRQAARALGIPVTTLNGYLRGRRQPRGWDKPDKVRQLLQSHPPTNSEE